MARKFSIGDTVQVVNGDDFEPDFKKGHRGKVIDYEKWADFPYTIVRNNEVKSNFKARELKLIRKGTKNGTN